MVKKVKAGLFLTILAILCLFPNIAKSNPWQDSPDINSGSSGETVNQDNTQSDTKSEYGSTVTITGPKEVSPNQNYDIILSGVTEAPIIQWVFLENNVLIEEGHIWGNRLDKTFTFNKTIAGDYVYLLHFRGLGGAHGWPPLTDVSIAVSVIPTIPTIKNISELITQYYQEGKIKNEGIYNSLLAKIKEAQKFLSEGDISTTINKLNALIEEIKAQMGKGIDEASAQELIRRIQLLINTLLTKPLCEVKIISFQHHRRPISEIPDSSDPVNTGKSKAVSENGGTLASVFTPGIGDENDYLWVIFKLLPTMSYITGTTLKCTQVDLTVFDDETYLKMYEGSLLPNILTTEGITKDKVFICDGETKYIGHWNLKIVPVVGGGKVDYPNLTFGDKFEHKYRIDIKAFYGGKGSTGGISTKDETVVEVFDNNKIGTLYQRWMEQTKSTRDIYVHGKKVSFFGEYYDVSYPMAYASYYKSKDLLQMVNEDFIRQSKNFGDAVWMNKVVKYLERLTGGAILQKTGQLTTQEQVSLAPTDVFSDKWDLILANVDKLNKEVAEELGKHPDPMRLPISGFVISIPDAEAAIDKMILSMAFLMVHHQTDLLKVVTDKNLAGPNKECSKTSFETVIKLLKDKQEELINATFPTDTQNLILEEAQAWSIISELINIGFLGSSEILNNKVREQVKPFLPDDMTESEKDEFLEEMFPSDITGVYEYSLNRVIEKMDP
ncbi:MAG: hypothetical protein AAB019_02295 [Planctomycetota bacterium]